MKITVQDSHTKYKKDNDDFVGWRVSSPFTYICILPLGTVSVCEHYVFPFGSSSSFCPINPPFILPLFSPQENELLVPVAHFQKEIYSTFGHPFLVKLREGERFEAVKDKIQKVLDVPDKEWEKYRIAVITLGRAKYLDDLPVDTVRIRDFISSGASGNNAKPYIGLEHINKNSKRPRYNYMEKAIKIYN